jgi:Flp pilus assembly pilin Flp
MSRSCDNGHTGTDTPVLNHAWQVPPFAFLAKGGDSAVPYVPQCELFTKLGVICNCPAGGREQAKCMEYSLRQTAFCISQPNRGVQLGPKYGGANMLPLFLKLWQRDEGQDIAEYAVMLAVILVLVVGTIRLVGSNANNVFSNVASSIQ